MTRLFKFVFMLAGISVSSLILADQIQPLLDVGQSRQAAEKTSQSKIDEMEEQTSVIVSEIKTVSKQIEGLRVYNAQMRQQIQRQEERLKEIDKTLKEAEKVLKGYYKKKTNLRKPGNLMIKRILNKWIIDIGKSFMIGDKMSDKLAAKKSNLKFYFTQKDFYTQIKKNN